MARTNFEIIQALRLTAAHLEQSKGYQWGHMGACNCGFLCQQITRLDKAEIHRRALQGHGDWREQLNDYCPTSGLPFDDIISELLRAGFDIDDLRHLERLSDPAVIQSIPGKRVLLHNCREDVVLYLLSWASLLEMQMLGVIRLPQDFLEQVPQEHE